MRFAYTGGTLVLRLTCADGDRQSRSVYIQLGTTNMAYLDGTEKARDGTGIPDATAAHRTNVCCGALLLQAFYSIRT
jgi:hypothetical protein